MKILIVESRFYNDLSDMLLAGAVEALDKAGVAHDTVTVPGALELPGAIAFAEAGSHKYDGYVALGIIIRGETSHYDYVCSESMRGLQDLVLTHHIALGNGIQTCENRDQVLARVDKARKNKGGAAALATLRMIDVKRQLQA